jgi:hypothetical protein
MKIKNPDKLIFFVALFTVIYIGLIFLNGTFIKIENVVLGVIQQLTTLPTILLQFALLLFATFRFVKGGFKILSYSFFTSFLLITSLTLIVLSFVLI